MQNDLPKGFMAGTAEAGFKKPGRPDLGIIFSKIPCVAAGLFTRNLFAAAPVQIDRQIIKENKKVQAIIGNSGQANACTGSIGLLNCRQIQKMAGKLLDITADEILLISTGVIGAQFNMNKWEKSLPDAVKDLGKKDAEGFTRAIMTTDAFPKFASAAIELSKGHVRLAVMAKGAGMICPNMATMLCVCLTDAMADETIWQNIFKDAADQTFNRVSVDGDTSTNDTIIGLANGASGVSLANAKDREIFQKELIKILGTCAYMLVKDGEGAKKVLHISVKGALTDTDAEIAARAVGNSQLVKTAIYGGDANWGRIINAVGYSGIKCCPDEVSLKLCGIERFRQGQPANDDKEEILAELLKRDDVDIEICLGAGQGQFCLQASDLGHEYVSLNADYRS